MFRYNGRSATASYRFFDPFHSWLVIKMPRLAEKEVLVRLRVEPQSGTTAADEVVGSLPEQIPRGRCRDSRISYYEVSLRRFC